MREIKFRVWNKFDDDYIKLEKANERGLVWFSGSLIECIDEIVIEQFTGLSDITGKEIYDKDILYCEGKLSDKWNGSKDPKCILQKRRKLFIDWHDGKYWLKTQKKRGIKWTLDSKIIHQNSLVVFGNIHENPEIFTK